MGQRRGTRPVDNTDIYMILVIELVFDKTSFWLIFYTFLVCTLYFSFSFCVCKVHFLFFLTTNLLLLQMT